MNHSHEALLFLYLVVGIALVTFVVLIIAGLDVIPLENGNLPY